MKRSNGLQLLGLALIPVLIAWATPALAGQGGGSTGGGDMCEDRIKVIREDLRCWIEKGGPSGLKLPEWTSPKDYSDRMLAKIDRAQISCVGPGDKGYPVTVGRKPKVCRFDTAGGDQFRCDFLKFNATSESDQYVQIHHEYAGLAGIEPPNADDSNYDVSNQISEFLVDVVIKKLAVKPASIQEPASSQFCVSKYDNFDSARGSYHTWCPGIKYPLVTKNVNRMPVDADFELVTRAISAQGFRFIGAFFRRYAVLLHVNHELEPSARYCVVAHDLVEKRFGVAAVDKYYLDCLDGSLQVAEGRVAADQLLERERLEYVRTVPVKFNVNFDGMMRPDLLIYKGPRRQW